MNKISATMLGVCALALASCSNHDAPDASAHMMSFTISVPQELQSRAISDGTTVDMVSYAVYEVVGSAPTQTLNYLFKGEDPSAFSGNSTTATVTIPIMKGKAYQVAFFAHNSNAPYALDDAGYVHMNYGSTQDANDEELDAFYGLSDVYIPGTTAASTVYLHRPFAQVNVGSSDWLLAKTAGMDVQKTGMVFTAEVYTKLNLKDATVSDPASVTFQKSAWTTLSDSSTTPAWLNISSAPDTYYWIGMNYVLVPEQTSATTITTLTFTYDGGSANTATPIYQVPVKRNYRTNIIGEFFNDNSTFTIEIVPSYNDPDFDQNLI